jgi:hypothetical protein
MESEPIQQIVVRAVQQAYDAWAVEHPTLASVIDRIELTQQAVESLRQTQAYRDAVDAYHQSQGDVNLLNRLLELAGPILDRIFNG